MASWLAWSIAGGSYFSSVELTVFHLYFCHRTEKYLQYNDGVVRWCTVVLQLTGESSVQTGIQAVTFLTMDAHSSITSGICRSDCLRLTTIYVPLHHWCIRVVVPRVKKLLKFLKCRLMWPLLCIEVVCVCWIRWCMGRNPPALLATLLHCLPHCFTACCTAALLHCLRGGSVEVLLVAQWIVLIWSISFTLCYTRYHENSTVK